MSKFRVFHNYGMEGWKPVDLNDAIDFETIGEAVAAREDDVTNGGGESIIVEVIPILEAYRRADYEEGRKKS